MTRSRSLVVSVLLGHCLLSSVAGADTVRDQTVRNHRRLRDAEQLAESGAINASNRLLSGLIGDSRLGGGLSPIELRATRQLAENCYSSGLYGDAIRYAQRLLTPARGSHETSSVALQEHRIDAHLLLARARLGLGDTESAERELDLAAEEFAGLAADPSVRRVDQRVRLLETHARLFEDESAPPAYAGPPPEFDLFPEEHFARAVRVWVEGLSDMGRHAEAAATIARLGLPETATQRLGYRQLTELHALRMHSLILAQRSDSTSSTAAEAEEAAARVRRVLANWSEDHESRRRADGSLGIADLQELASRLSLEADWCERQAASLMLTKPTDREAREAVWTRATEVLARLRSVITLLAERSDDLDNDARSEREAIQEFARQRLDRALAGYQRVLLRLRDSATGLSDSSRGLLRDVSTELVALRRDRLPGADPRLLESRLAYAFVLGSEGDHATAIAEFTDLIEQDAGRRLGPFWEAQAWLGLGMSRLAEHRLDDAAEALNHARKLVGDHATRPGSRRRLDQHSDAALGYLAMLQGEYRSAAQRLTRLDSSTQSEQASEDDSVRSTAKVFLSLLRRSEADYQAARDEIEDGRRLADSPYVGRRHETAYDLSEAALLLSEAAAQSSDRGRLDRAGELLDAVEHRSQTDGASPAIGHSVIALRSQSLALQGQEAAAERMMLALAEGAGVDAVTRARAFLGLSRLVRTGDPTNRQPGTLHRALGYAERAVAALSSGVDGSSEAIYPNLTFQANSESGWLIDAIDRTGSAQVLVAKPTGEAIETISFTRPAQRSDLAIARLEAAVRVAEQPATQTTAEDLGRSRFFTRYAPAYDLLVGLRVRAAARLAGAEGEPFAVRSGSPAYGELVRAMEVSDLARNRTFRESVGFAMATPSPTDRPLGGLIESLVDPDEALLVYHLGGMRWRTQRSGRGGRPDGEGWLFLVTDRGQEIACYPLSSGEGRPLSRAEAQRVVTPYVELLGKPPEQRQPRGEVQVAHREIAKQCTDAVLPLAARRAIAAAKGVKLLTIVPDGPLHQLPFEALLRLSQRERVWEFAADWLPPIAYGPSLSVLASIHHAPSRLGGWEKVVSVGAPDYGAAGRADSPAGERLLRHVGPASLAPLPNAEEEIDAVVRAFGSGNPNGVVVSAKGAAASEAFLRREVRGATVLHIAAHAFASRRAEDGYAVVALAPNDPLDPADDGLLELQELASLPLDGCELAILSACETLVGADRPLEVGMSLTRALLEQQTRRVVSSHWQVDDRATAALAPAFCQRLVDASDPGRPSDYASALRDAKDDLRSGRLAGAAEAGYRDPYYWAPMVLVGAR